ncbi:MAG: hypothetical protein K0S44_157 [Bacteroidetes bacterium]|nr:hypothetical protein [Bacteroidota bacterium]
MLFFLKIAAAVSVWLLYTFYYSGSDFLTYFSDSSVLIHNLFNPDHQEYSSVWEGSFNNSVFNSARMMICLNAFLHIFSFGNFYVHGLFFCFFSFLGLVALLKNIANHFPEKRNVIIALFFIPSIIFWGSAPLKESVIIGVAGLLVFLTDFGLRINYSKKTILMVFLMVGLLSVLKIYVLLALFPLLITNQLIARTSVRFVLLKYIAVFALMAACLFLSSLISDELNILKIISDKQAKAISEAKGGIFLADDKNFVCVDYGKKNDVLEMITDSTYRIKKGSTFMSWKLENMSDTTFVVNSQDTSIYKILYQQIPARSVIPVRKLKPVITEYLAYTPIAFINTLIRPGFWEIRSWLQLIMVIENLWIVFLIVLSIVFFDKGILNKKHIVIFCILFSLIIFVLIGLTTPVIGAMVRYKTIGLLFLSVACIIMLDTNRLRKIFSR